MLNLNTYRQHKNYELERNKRRIKDVFVERFKQSCLWYCVVRFIYVCLLFAL